MMPSPSLSGTRGMLDYIAMTTGILAAVLVSANLSMRITGYAFIIFTVSSCLWVYVGMREGEPALSIQNVALTLINLFGVYRWLIAKQPG